MGVSQLIEQLAREMFEPPVETVPKVVCRIRLNCSFQLWFTSSAGTPTPTPLLPSAMLLIVEQKIFWRLITLNIQVGSDTDHSKYVKI